VTDPTAAVVGEAKLTAVNAETNARSTTTTTQTGNYTLPALLIGRNPSLRLVIEVGEGKKAHASAHSLNSANSRPTRASSRPA